MSAQVIDLESRRPRKVEQVACRMCNHSWAAVFPLGADEANVLELQCPKCAYHGACFVVAAPPEGGKPA